MNQYFFLCLMGAFTMRVNGHDVETPKTRETLALWFEACERAIIVTPNQPTTPNGILPSFLSSPPFPPFQSNRSFPCSVAATYSDELWLI